MKRCLLCLLFLLAAGCQRRVFDVGGELYVVRCSPNLGTYIIETLGFPNELVGGGSYDPKSSTCYQIANILASQASSFTGANRAATIATPAQPFQYLLDQATLSVQVLDPSTFQFTEVDLPGGGNTQYPTSMAMTPDGSTIWVTQLAFGQNNSGITPKPPLVSIFNVAQQAFTGSFPLPNGISPNSVQFSTDGTLAYLTNDGAPSGGASGVFANSSVLVVNTKTQTVARTIPTPKGAGGAALSPDGLLLYTIGNNFGLGSNNLTVIDTTTNTVATSLALPNGSMAIFVNRTGTRLYNLWSRGIDVFDTATLQQLATIPAQNSTLTNFAYFSQDGTTAFICGCGYGPILQIDVRTNQVINTIQGQAHSFFFGTP